MPKMGKDVETLDGFGTVVDLNILKETVSVRIHHDDSNEIKTYSVNDVVWFRMDREGDRQGSGQASRRREKSEDDHTMDSSISIAIDENAEIKVLVENDDDSKEIAEDDDSVFTNEEDNYEQEPLSQEIDQGNTFANDWQAEVAQALRNTNDNK
jgi:hypothetical protein